MGSEGRGLKAASVEGGEGTQSEAPGTGYTHSETRSEVHSEVHSETHKVRALY